MGKNGFSHEWLPVRKSKLTTVKVNTKQGERKTWMKKCVEF